MRLFCERCERGVTLFDNFCPSCGLFLGEPQEELFLRQCPVMTFEIQGERLHFIHDGVEVVFEPGKPKSARYEGKYKGVHMTAAQLQENALEIQRRSNSYKAYIWLKTNFDVKVF